MRDKGLWCCRLWGSQSWRKLAKSGWGHEAERYVSSGVPDKESSEHAFFFCTFLWILWLIMIRGTGHQGGVKSSLKREKGGISPANLILKYVCFFFRHSLTGYNHTAQDGRRQKKGSGRMPFPRDNCSLCQILWWTPLEIKIIRLHLSFLVGKFKQYSLCPH